MGDHAYDMAYAGDRRGDAYMNSFEPTIASCPWLPIIGNHESDDGDHFQHYAAIAWGEEYGLDGNHSFPGADQRQVGAESVSTATSPLGRSILGCHSMYNAVYGRTYIREYILYTYIYGTPCLIIL